MAKIYVKGVWQDEILSGPELYDIKDNVGAPIHSDAQIALKTAVIQAGTLADAAKMNNIEAGIDAIDTRVDANETIQNMLLTGWIAGVLVWTYASATSLTIPGNVTALFPKGTRIKLTQTTVKYFYVTAASYSSPNTTLTLTGGSDYTLANAAITDPAYSYMDAPQGFPGWFSWTPVFTGFSVDPPANVWRFRISGSVCFVKGGTGTGGTSNATTFTMTIPVIGINGASFAPCRVMDNGTYLVAPGMVTFSAVATLYTNMLNGAWTATGGKVAWFNTFYEF
jgi:hypothetical protein